MSPRPWYETHRRWGQTNLVEADPGRFDLDWWRAQWARTHVQGILVNCGGIAAYYPSAIPGHKLAPGIADRDLFGEIVTAAREDGLAVLARMDSNRGDAEVFGAHPEWFCFQADGEPYRRGDKYATCISSSYYDEFMPSIFREVIEGYSPDGFADNGWAGIDRSKICYCANCAASFHRWSKRELPARTDWADETFQHWIEWSYARRTQLWENNNAATKAAGGPHCLWLGMLHGQIAHNASVFQDVAEIAKRTPVVLLDHQRRHGDEGFEQNAEVAKRIHSVLGWDKSVLECTAMYDMGYPAFRLSSMPRAEVELWMTSGWAGGTQPWWHHIGSRHDDRRQYETPVDLFQWHKENEDLLVDRTPVASVGVVWSQRSFDFYGGEDGTNRTITPYAGINRVLVCENIPFTPVHIDKIDEAEVSTLILPDLGAMSDAQCEAVRGFVRRGGSLIATGNTSLFDEFGRQRTDFGLADLFGAHATTTEIGALSKPQASIEIWDRHSYLRLDSQLASRHEVLAGLESTATISFGGSLRQVVVDAGACIPLTYIPAFPIFPPETSWMREPATDIAAMVVRELTSGQRIAFIPADLDRCSDREEQPDHARVLSNTVRWAARGAIEVEVSSPALVNTNLYRSSRGFVLHLNNLIYTSQIPGRQSRITPYGPIDIQVHVGPDFQIGEVVGEVDAGPLRTQVDDGWLKFTVALLGVHEVIRIDRKES